MKYFLLSLSILFIFPISALSLELPIIVKDFCPWESYCDINHAKAKKPIQTYKDFNDVRHKGFIINQGESLEVLEKNYVIERFGEVKIYKNVPQLESIGFDVKAGDIVQLVREIEPFSFQIVVNGKESITSDFWSSYYKGEETTAVLEKRPIQKYWFKVKSESGEGWIAVESTTIEGIYFKELEISASFKTDPLGEFLDASYYEAYNKTFKSYELLHDGKGGNLVVNKDEWWGLNDFQKNFIEKSEGFENRFGKDFWTVYDSQFLDKAGYGTAESVLRSFNITEHESCKFMRLTVDYAFVKGPYLNEESVVTAYLLFDTKQSKEKVSKYFKGYSVRNSYGAFSNYVCDDNRNCGKYDFVVYENPDSRILHIEGPTEMTYPDGRFEKQAKAKTLLLYYKPRVIVNGYSYLKSKGLN